MPQKNGGDNDLIERLAELIDHSTKSVAFTGAGISTESGIPDFRSPGGVWTRHKPVMYDDFVRSREARISYWKMRVEAYADFSSAKPNAGHLALARMEAAGLIEGVVTQNIDGLHQIAGSKRVIELHGTARIVACISCGREWTPEEIHGRIAAGDEAPDCDDCGSPLKSRTVSFGQAMPAAAMQESYLLARSCDLMLAIGSSLVVEPAASIPRTAAQHGAKLVIINREETPLDYLSLLTVRGSIGETLGAAMKRLRLNQ